MYAPMPPAAFHTTRWTRVCAAKLDCEDGRRALADLCDAYYEPVLAFLRCELREADAAQDAAHAFFEQVLSRGGMQAAEPERGRFRSYLLAAVKHFVSHQREAVRRQKRGGGVPHATLDDTEARQVPDLLQFSPDHEFDRQWALAVLRHGLDRLRRECADEGKESVFDRIQPWLSGGAETGDQAALAAELGINLNSLKSHVHRLKRRFRALVKDEIAGTLVKGGSVADELAVLFAALRKN
jgi:DNA-directed RNA polymerase specialized sigma24 family protein